MSTKAKFDELLAAVNTATDKLADAVGVVKTDVAGLKAQIAELLRNQGMTGAEEDAVLAAFDAPLARLATVEGNLRSIGSDPENPVPEPAAGV